MPQRDVLASSSVSNQRVERPFDEAVDDEVVETGGHDSEPCTLRDAQRTFEASNDWARRIA